MLVFLGIGGIFYRGYKNTIMSQANTLKLLGQTPVIHATPYNGEKIYRGGSKTNGFYKLYKVPESSILWLYNYYLDALFSGAGSGYIGVYDDNLNWLYNIDNMYGITNTAKHAGQTFQPPLVIEASFSMRLVSSNGNATMACGIFGYLFGV